MTYRRERKVNLMLGIDAERVGGSEKVVRAAGLEPARPLGRGILSPLCLPISPRPLT